MREEANLSWKAISGESGDLRENRLGSQKGLMKSYPFPAFFFIWGAISIVGFLLFYVGKDAAFKRRWYPWFTIFSGIVFGSFAISMDTSLIVPIVPIIALITFLNIKFTKFCDRCGVTIGRQGWFTKLVCCPECGAELNAGEETQPRSNHRQIPK